MYKTTVNNDIFTISTGAGVFPSTVFLSVFFTSVPRLPTRCVRLCRALYKGLRLASRQGVSRQDLKVVKSGKGSGYLGNPKDSLEKIGDLRED